MGVSKNQRPYRISHVILLARWGCEGVGWGWDLLVCGLHPEPQLVRGGRNMFGFPHPDGKLYVFLCQLLCCQQTDVGTGHYSLVTTSRAWSMPTTARIHCCSSSKQRPGSHTSFAKTWPTRSPQPRILNLGVPIFGRSMSHVCVRFDNPAHNHW